MSQLHLIDHLDAARMLAERGDRPFLAYLIRMAKDEALGVRYHEAECPTSPADDMISVMQGSAG
ncbi:hypothetical protein QTL95_05875 [Rhizobium sp. S152]|uniref:hypothetical protein n=1 Tax=Rhizobium sp. S152 TaxID=3055038 RepID=UPI0025A9A2EA|nr:hypothetical protein [Rhizobium sp. S152]MDM9625413.1 hypothetical protein [Rhizobium sp. S152]